MCQNDDIPNDNRGKIRSFVAKENLLTNVFFFVIDKFRNGIETATQTYTGTKATDVSLNRRLHESWDHYNRCITRERNKGSLKIIFEMY